MKNSQKGSVGSFVSIVVIIILIIAGGVYFYFNNKSHQKQNISSTATTSKTFYITPTSASPSDRIYAYNSGFNNEYSELCFDNANQPPNACSGISISTDFSALNPLMSFVIPSDIGAGSHSVQVCGLIGEGSGDQTSGCTDDVMINIVLSTTATTTPSCGKEQMEISIWEPQGLFDINNNIWTATDTIGCVWNIDYKNASFYAENAGANPSIWSDPNHSWWSSLQQYLAEVKNGTVGEEGWSSPFSVYIIGYHSASQHDNTFTAYDIIYHAE